MVGVAVLHLYAYPWKIYQVNEREKTDTTSDSSIGVTGVADLNEKTGGGGRIRIIESPNLDHLPNLGGTLGWRALLEALNWSDVALDVAMGFRWLIFRRKGDGIGDHDLQSNPRRDHVSSLADGFRLYGSAA
jgi:hypothetical protein